MSYIEDLKKNPIFAMSLSSKELFHSNFWAWLFERNIEYAKIFFTDLKEISSVKREQGNRDITIWEKFEIPKRKAKKLSRAYIIENKCKSLPNKKQLKDYSTNLKGQLVQGVVTGIVEPSFINDPDMASWSFLSYKTIGEGIIDVAECVESEGFDKQAIKNYGEMLKSLALCLTDKLNITGQTWNTANPALAEIRIADIYSKLLAAELIKYLKENLTLDCRVRDYDLVIEQYFGKNGAGVDIRYKSENTDNEISVIGIQIDGNQYRWCIQTNKEMKVYSDETRELYEFWLEQGWFVEYDHTKFKRGKKEIVDHIDSTIKRKTGMGAVKNHPGTYPYRIYSVEYTFMYQYWFVDGLPFSEIGENIKRDMDYAKDILLKL